MLALIDENEFVATVVGAVAKRANRLARHLALPQRDVPGSDAGTWMRTTPLGCAAVGLLRFAKFGELKTPDPALAFGIPRFFGDVLDACGVEHADDVTNGDVRTVLLATQCRSKLSRPAVCEPVLPRELVALSGYAASTVRGLCGDREIKRKIADGAPTREHMIWPGSATAWLASIGIPGFLPNTATLYYERARVIHVMRRPDGSVLWDGDVTYTSMDEFMEETVRDGTKPTELVLVDVRGACPLAAVLGEEIRRLRLDARLDVRTDTIVVHTRRGSTPCCSQAGPRATGCELISFLVEKLYEAQRSHVGDTQAPQARVLGDHP